MKAKSRTTGGGLPNPCGTVPSAASLNVKLDVMLGAWDPVNPLRPEGLAFPRGGKSKPIAVMVEVDPGCAIAEVLVIVNVNVFVWELNSQTTVAVENWPESTPTTLIVSALTVAALNRIRAKIDDAMFLKPFKWAMVLPLTCTYRFGSMLISVYISLSQGSFLPCVSCPVPCQM